MSATAQLAEHLLEGLAQELEDARDDQQPLEVEPHRGRIFDAFVRAYRAGLTRGDSDPDLSADAICQAISQRWSLDRSARSAVETDGKMSADDLSKMRMLWSLMRMWIEWGYAWERYPEFHEEEG